MGSTYGRQELGTVGRSIQVIASDFFDASWKPFGITVDWDTVDALTDDVTLLGGTTILKGQKYIPLGTVMVEMDSGYYGPFDDGANDGRDTLARGKAYILNEDVTENVAGFGIVQGNASKHPGVFDGGLVFKGRLQVGG